MNVKHVIESRISVNRFDTGRALSDADISELVRMATLAPSAYNFQNWKFIAVRTPQAKERLKASPSATAEKVVDAPVTFIIVGTLAAHEGLSQALKPSVDAGIMPQKVADVWGRHGAGYAPRQSAVAAGRSAAFRFAGGDDDDAGRRGAWAWPAAP